MSCICPTDLSQCCSKLEIVSTGLARRWNSESLGMYEYYTNGSTSQVYKHIGQTRFLYRSPYYEWVVGKIICIVFIRMYILKYLNMHYKLKINVTHSTCSCVRCLISSGTRLGILLTVHV